MMDDWTTEETEDGFRLNYSEDFSVYAYADAAALEEIKDAHNAERDRLAAENAELRNKLDWAQQMLKAQEQTSNGVAWLTMTAERDALIAKAVQG